MAAVPAAPAVCIARSTAPGDHEHRHRSANKDHAEKDPGPRPADSSNRHEQRYGEEGSVENDPAICLKRSIGANTRSYIKRFLPAIFKFGSASRPIYLICRAAAALSEGIAAVLPQRLRALGVQPSASSVALLFSGLLNTVVNHDQRVPRRG